MRVRRAILALFLTGGLLAVPLWLGFGQGGAEPSNDSLSAYLKLDETTAGTAADSSGDANPGTVSGATASSDVPVTVFQNARSLSFDGNDYVEAASSPELNPTSLTLSLWVKFNALNGTQTVVAKWDSSYQQQYVIQAQDDALYFYTGDGSNVTADSIVSSVTLATGTWYHVVGTITGTNRTISVNGTTDTDTAATTLGSSVNPFTIGAKQNNDGPYFEYLDGLVDEVRVYSRVLGAGELADLTAGNHTSATWDGSSNSDYETAGNWDIGAVPDPYTYVTVPDSTNQPQASAAISLAALDIGSGARLNLAGYDLTFNDGGTFSNDGTLQLRNSETLTSFSNDTDSGAVLLTADADITGLKTGNAYHDLIINDSTFAHWPLDETSGIESVEASGFARHAAYQGAPVPDTEVAAVEFANDRSLRFDGADDHLSFDSVAMPSNATWCSWFKLDGSADGVIIGSSTAEHFALGVFGGNEIRVRNQADDEQVSWAVGSLGTGWHHACITQTYTITASLGLYLDGAAVGGSEVLTSGAGEINTIGRGGSYYFDGLIDDVRIFNRALGPSDVADLYTGTKPDLYVSTQSLGAALDINGDLTIASGRLDVSAGNYAISIGGDFRNDGGVFVPQAGTVTLDGGSQRINSSNTFSTLIKQVTAPATLTFGKDSTTTVTTQLMLTGTSGNLLSLRSSAPGTQWLLDAAGSETVGYLDVQDSNNIATEPVDITGANVTDSGNNVNWTVNVAPDDPVSLGPSQVINGGFITDDTPTFNFTLADDNPVDQLRYRIQIDDNSDFSDPEIDYTSALGAQGARSYTAGQVDSDDTYTVGSDNMLMTSADYYWRVRAIDDYDTPNQSAYTVANGGAVAFRLDVSGPSTPGTPTTASAQTDRRPQWNWTASTDTGSGLANPTYTLQWSTDNTFMSGVSAATTNNTTFTHSTNLGDGQWYFRVRASDTLGNHSAWAVSAVHLIDNTGPTTPVAPFTASPTGINTPTWSWAASSDAGIGLHPTAPYVLNWSLTSNFSSGVFSTTSSTNIFTHSTSLVDGTWYMRVKAVDGLGNESSWSSSSTVLIDGTSPSLPGMPQTTDPTNDNTPTWTWDASLDTGSGLASSPYTVQWSSSPTFSPLTGSTSADTATYTHGTPLADGTWYIRVSARDQLSNQSGYSSTGTVTIDTVAPDAPNAPTTTSPTNDNTPAWTWNTPADVGVGLAASPYDVEWSQDSDFNTVTGTANVASASFTHADALAEGTWYIRVSATDAAGNTSSLSANGSVEIDVTAPTVPGDPSTADPIPDNTPTWTWNVSTDSGVGLAATPYEVQWSTDNTFTTGVSTDTAATATYTHGTPLSDGTWYFRVRAVDSVGNWSTYSGSGQKTVDINPPTTPGDPATATPTADNTPAWTWSPSTDAGVGLSATPYMIEWSTAADFSSNSFADSIADAAFTHPDPLADGTWYFRVRAQDNVGNISAYSNTVSVFVDASDPTDPGTPSATSPTADDTPAWTWTASTDSGIGLANPAYTVEWSQASDFSGGVQQATTNTNSYAHTVSLADGTWYFRVRAADGVGNVSNDSATASVEVDDTAPAVPGQPSTATPTDDTTPAWTWSASTDNGVGLADPAYELQWSQAIDFSSGVLSGTSNSNSYTHTVPLADGTWYFRVRALDTLSNTSAYSTSGSVLISTSGPTDPGTPSTTTPTTDDTPAWTWAASSSPAGLATPAYSVEWSQDSGFGSGVSSDTSTTESFTHSTPLSDGTWYFRVIAEDNTGLYSNYSLSGSVLVDTTAPSVPGVASATTPTADTTPAWTWSASTDGGAGLATPAYSVEWSQDSGFGSGVSSDTSTTESFTHSTPLSDGTWYFRIQATDAVGNTSAFAANGSIVIDATPPDVPGTAATTSPTADTTPAWTWSASADSGVGLDDPAYEVQWSQSSSFSSGISSDTSDIESFTHSTPLSDGTWYFRVRAVDMLGNASAYSANGSVEVDASVPAVPGTPTTGGASTNDTTPAWTWSASADSGVGLGTPAYETEWSQDSGFLSGVSNGTTNSAAFTHPSDLGPGTWYFRVRAVDDVGNRSGYSGNGEVFIDTDTPSAPGTPAPAETPTADRTPAWTWSASADSGVGFGSNPYELQWSTDNTFVSGVQSAVAASESYTHTVALADGTWYFRVRAVDDALNYSAYSSYGTVVVDGSAPVAPANLSTPTPTKDPTPTWSWDASSDGGIGLDDPAYEVQWSLSSSFSSGVSSATTNDALYAHSAELPFGVWYFRVRAADTLGNKTAWVTASVSIDNTPPAQSGVQATAGNSTALITWQTDEPASNFVQYGVGGQFSESTTEAHAADRVTSHSVGITGLPPCTTIEYRTINEDSLENVRTGESKTFTTNGCSGNAAIMAQTRAYLSNGSGGTLGLSGGSANLSLNVPAGFAGTGHEFQIKQLSPAAALSPIGQPDGVKLLGSHAYDLKALAVPGSLTTSFDQPLAISVTYVAADIAGYDTASAALYRYDGSSWQKLQGCSASIAVRTVSCQTTGFSVFGLFAKRAAPAEPTPALPEGEGIVEPIPEPVTETPAAQEAFGETEAAESRRGLSAAFTAVIDHVASRPAWYAGAAVFLAAVMTLAFITKRRVRAKTHVPYGIHRDD